MGVLEQVLSVFDAIGTWIGSAFTSLIPIFYEAENGLTFMGVLAVAGLAMAVIFLLLNVIQNFLHFRG